VPARGGDGSRNAAQLEAAAIDQSFQPGARALRKVAIAAGQVASNPAPWSP
jgi:hypothetical protein